MGSENPPPLPTAQELQAHQLRPDQLQPPTSFPSSLPPLPVRTWNPTIRSFGINVQAILSDVILGRLNTFRIYDRHLLLSALHRPSNQALLTVSNHQSTMDDPVLLAALTPKPMKTDIDALRWGWCSRELCFSNSVFSWFFRYGKIAPIIRGGGLYQEGMREAEEHLAQGRWFHIFPEGKCIPLKSGIGPLRWGAAKLIADAYRRADRCRREKEMYLEELAASREGAGGKDTAVTPAPTSNTALSFVSSASPFASSPSSSPLSSSSLPSPSSPSSLCPLPPLVVPFVHHGMPKLLPFYHAIPKTGHLVRAIVGDEIKFDDLIRFSDANMHNRLAFDYPLEEDLYAAITRRIQTRMEELDEKLVRIEADEGDVDPLEPTPPASLKTVVPAPAS